VPRSKVRNGPMRSVTNVYRINRKVRNMEEHWMKRKSMKKVSAKIKSRKWTNGSSMTNAYRTNRKLKQNGGTLDTEKEYGKGHCQDQE